MNNFYRSTLVAASLLLNGANLGLLADGHDEKPNRKAHLEEMKREVAHLRAKAKELKELGRHEAAEEVIHHAKELFQKFKKEAEHFEHREGREHVERDRDHGVREKLHAMEERMERLRRAGKHEEAEELHHHMREMIADLKDRSHDREHGERVVKERRIVIRKNRDGEHGEGEHHHERRHEERHDTEEISPEDHVQVAIEHLHAAGWHDAAEHLEREFHQRMEQQRHHEENPFHAQLREMMEGVEHRFNAVREHMEHMERALQESAHRLERLEKHVRESHEKQD
jgi:hypothetical protein